MMPKSRPVLIVFSILAGAQVMTNATGLSEVIPSKYMFLAGIIVAAVQTGMTFYVQNQTVPLQDVAAYDSGKPEVGLVAGPAAVPANGVPVQVTPTP